MSPSGRSSDRPGASNSGIVVDEDGLTVIDAQLTPRLGAELGISLAAIGALLLALRTLDFVQDPLLGWIAQRFPNARAPLAALAILSVGIGFIAVFTLQPGIIGLGLWLTLIFTGFSLGSILFYSQCADLAGQTRDTHYQLAGWRESGTLVGIIAAAALPAIFAFQTGTTGGYAALHTQLH